jgi:two-component system CheB/CheR fusion protein
MDEFRAISRDIRDLEREKLKDFKDQSAQRYKTAWFMVLLSTTVGIGLVIGVLHAVHRRRITAERDAETIRNERQRLEKALSDRQLFERRSNKLDQHIRLFVDQIQDYAIFTISTDYKATSWNKGVSKVLGFEEEEFVGQDIRPLIFTPESNANGTTANEFRVATDRGSASDDRWMMRKGQVRFWATGITSSIRNEHDQLIGFSKVMRDMTMQKQSSDELSRLASELSEESRRKNEFLATLAHELRNPLSPIKNAIQLMELMPLDGEINDLRATMARQVDQMVRLIDDLLDISRIGRGKLELKRESVPVETIINAAVEASLPLIQANTQELEVHIDAREMVVYMDSGRMTQVLCNLLNNASKYSPANCKIQLFASQENDNVLFRVQDNGNGIAPDRIESIFDIFSQLEDSIERGVAGLGIGLALVRTIVELHGGTVVAKSEGVGLGSVFTITIPNSLKSDQQNSSALNSVQNVSSRFYRVLVVEDMRALAVVLARLLSKMGHHVEMVENGEAAIEKLKNFDAEVVFSDISMPMMTGYELARYLRSHNPDSKMKLVAMTGYGQLSDREKAFAAGFDEHMTKPVDINRLREFFNGLSDEPINAP